MLIAAGGSSAGILAAVVVKNVGGRSAPKEAAKTKLAAAPAKVEPIR
jgi:hypothetical protein